MALDTRWKLPQGKTPEQLHDAIVQIVRELRKGDFLPGTPDATDIAYDNATSGMTADTVQEALDENDGRLDDLEAAPAGLVLLNSGTVTNQATLDIVLTSFTAYRGLLFVLSNLVPATDDREFWMQLSTDGGANYDAGAGNYRYSNVLVTENVLAAQGSTADTKVRLAGNSAAANESVSNTAAEGGVSALVNILNQTSTAIWPRVQSAAAYLGTDGRAFQNTVNGQRVTAQDTDAVRFLFESGNIASGNWALYGYA